jgi:tetratricopeptide (TPR) repeat protein
MGIVARWIVAVTGSVVAFAVAWWICGGPLHLDEGVSLGVAGAMLAIVLGFLYWWAGRELPADAFSLGGNGSAGAAGLGRGIRAGSRRTPRMLPPDTRYFTGREVELARLASQSEGGRVVVTAVGGTAGVGKTALAVHAAHRLSDRFPDGQFYADLRGYTEGQQPAEPAEILDLFLRQLGVHPEEIPSTLDERSALLRTTLADRRALMLLDNVASASQVRPLLPGSGQTLVLVTSRSVLLGLDADERINLDVLPLTAARSLLTAVVGPDRAAAEPAAVDLVCERCSNLPLALRIAAQLLAAHQTWPVSRLASMLADERTRLASLQVDDAEVRAAFAVSYGQLSPDDARFFRLIGLHIGPDCTPASLAALADADQADTAAALARLADARLLTEDPAGRFRLHDLLRLFARDLSEEADDQGSRVGAENRLLDYYLNLARHLNSFIDPVLRPAADQAATESGAPIPSAGEGLALFAAERSCLLAAVSLGAQLGRDDLVMDLVGHIGVGLRLLRYFDDLLVIAQAGLAAAVRVGDVEFVSREQGHLGMASRVLGRFDEAIASYEGALTAVRELGDRRREGWALNHLGITYQESGRIDEAIACCEEALLIAREVGDRRAEAQALHNLGRAYGQRGSVDEAVGCYEEALDVSRATGARDGEAVTLNGLGGMLARSRRFERAAACWGESVAIRRELGDRYSEGRTAENLAVAYLATRQWGRAAECFADAAAAVRDVGEAGDADRLAQLAGQARRRGLRWIFGLLARWSLTHRPDSASDRAVG